jgi:DNA-binding FrmR family transcriptional regulator
MVEKSKIKNQKMKIDPISVRLNRVAGQIEGVKKMYEKSKCDCLAVIQQITAARAALSKISQLILLDEAKKCADEANFQKLKNIVNKSFKYD